MTTGNNKILITLTCMLLVVLASYGHAITCQEACGAGVKIDCATTKCSDETTYKHNSDGDADCGPAKVCCCPIASTSGAATSGASGSGASPSGASGGSDTSGFTKAPCTCKCNSKDLNSMGIYKGSDQNIAKQKCQDQCARTCGGFTNCSDQTDTGCTTCCGTFCTSGYTKGGEGSSTKPGEKVTDLCKTSCKSTCKFKGTVNGITDIIYMIAGLLGALMIAVHGIRMVTSQDPHDRDAAKSSIMHVIIALIIIAMAAALVNMFISMGGLDTATTTVTPAATAVDCSKYSSTESACNGAGGSGNCFFKSAGNCLACKDLSGKVIATCDQYWPSANTCNGNVCGISGGCGIVSRACVASTP